MAHKRTPEATSSKKKRDVKMADRGEKRECGSRKGVEMERGKVLAIGQKKSGPHGMHRQWEGRGGGRLAWEGEGW